jgi:hypothetical protein
MWRFILIVLAILLVSLSHPSLATATDLSPAEQKKTGKPYLIRFGDDREVPSAEFLRAHLFKLQQ